MPDRLRRRPAATHGDQGGHARQTTSQWGDGARVAVGRDPPPASQPSRRIAFPSGLERTSRSCKGTALLALAVIAVLLLGCGGAHSSSEEADHPRWRGLHAVAVSVHTAGSPVSPGPAESGGSRPGIRTFSGQGQLRVVAETLNEHDIRRIVPVKEDHRCTGGTEIRLRITRADDKSIALSAYRCAGAVSGDIGGDLNGFLASIGFEP